MIAKSPFVGSFNVAVAIGIAFVQLLLISTTAPCAAQTTWTHRCGPPPAGFPACGPAVRNLHVSAYAGNGRVLIQGGNNGNYLSDAWLWDGTAWQATGNGPIRDGHAMAFDSVRSTVVLFGGYGGNDGWHDDTWYWDQSTGWSIINPNGIRPQMRDGHAIAYDVARDVFVLFGGLNYSPGGGGAFLNDTWEYRPATRQWTLVHAGGSGAPPVRNFHCLAYAGGGRVLLQGGNNGNYLQDTWLWNGTTWIQHGPGPIRDRHAMAYCTHDDAVYLFGGYGGNDGWHNDTWRWRDSTGWVDVSPPGERPGLRDSHTLAYDSARGVLVLFGGLNYSAGGGFAADTWELQCGADCNGNGIPDPSEPDCNNNDIPDDCDIADCPPGDLTCRDCNGNGVPDDCDIAGGTSQDCQPNGVPDECELRYQAPRILPNNGAADDQFGAAVAADGDIIVVGAPNHDQLEQSVGAVYVWSRADSGSPNNPLDDTWILSAELWPADQRAGQYFGTTVAIDGDVVVIGAPGDNERGTAAGAAYVFRRGIAGWSNGAVNQSAKLLGTDTGPEDYFGAAVAIDANTIVVGASHAPDQQAGAAYVFVDSVQVAKLQPSASAPGDRFGNSTAIDGDTIVVGAVWADAVADESGAVYVFARDHVNPGTWDSGTADQQAMLTPSVNPLPGLRFGQSVSIFENTAITGAGHDDAGGAGSGAVYVFERTGSVWTHAARLVARDASPGDHLGVSVAIEGDIIVAGSVYNAEAGIAAGAGYVFRRGPNHAWDNGDLDQRLKLVPDEAGANDFTGFSVSVGQNVVVLGANQDGANGPLSGSAYAYLLLDDCNGNGIPDECDPDCDNDGIPDDCDPGSCCPNFPDCNGNGLPDECDCTIPPVVIDPPDAQRICIPQTGPTCYPGNATFRVAAAPPEAYCYRWQKENPLQPGSWTDLPLNNAHFDGVESATLTIVGVTLLDGGNYRVCVTNGCGTTYSPGPAESPATLTLDVPVCITQEPLGFTACAGTTRSMCAIATGNPPEQYQWYRNGLPIQGETQPCIVLSPLQSFDAGEYYVQVTGATCSLNSRSATVVVNALVGDIVCADPDCQPGDTQDGEVSLPDLTKLLSCFGYCSGDAGFDPVCDIDPNGCIDLVDLTLLLSHFGQRCP